MMTRKNYVAIAAAFAEQSDLKRDPKRRQMVKILAYALAEDPRLGAQQTP